MHYWNYRVIKDGEGNFYVAEVYYDDNDTIESWADYTPDILHWQEYEDLKSTAEYVLQAFERPMLTFVGVKLVEV